jgi:putative DNA primase/helicase
VVCPNHAEHTDDNVEARYNPSTRTYECFHAHCTDWTSAEFLAWVAAQGGPVREPGLRDDLLTATMQKTTAALVESTGIIIDEEAFAHEYTSPAAASASLQSATLDADIEKALRLVPTETNLAIAFTHRMKGKLLYAPQRGGWVKYVGTHWQPDKLNQAFNYCVQLARSIETDSKNIKTIGKASFAGGVERIARAEPAFARSLECFDSDPDLIATPAGTLDLRNGVLRPARPEDMITRCATATLKNGKPTRWMDMLDQAFDGDAEMIQFLQDFMGYGLTGRTAAEIFVYYDGPGGNGKSTISHMQRLIMGDYFGTASPKLLLYTPTPQHATTLASLQGKRFVVDAELPVGARLDEQKLKMLTGGGAVRANFMFNDEFDFVPELKLAIEANHQPRIVRPDDAMRRRLCVVPMPKVIPNPDPLFKKHILPQEVGEIFTWMLEGAVRVLARGEKFVRPARVQEASDAYLGSQDSVGVFIAERVVQDVKQHLAQGSIYAEYQRWANDVGETYVMPAREFYSELEKKGYRRSKYGGTHVFWGVTLPSTGSGNAFPHL